MKVLGFKPDSHYEIILEWWKAHGHPLAGKEELSTTGFICFDGNTPVAALFLILTNARFAYLETAVSNPKVIWKKRDEAFQLLINQASQVAKDLGFRRILCVPLKQGLMDKAKRNGFVILDERPYLCVKEL